MTMPQVLPRAGQREPLVQFAQTLLLAVVLAFALIPGQAIASLGNNQIRQLHDAGLRYERSSHTPTEFRRAYWAWCVAARLGDGESAYRIAWMYLNGRGLPRDDRLAGYWLAQAARLGDPQAQHLQERLAPTAARDDLNCPADIADRRINISRFLSGLTHFLPPRITLFDISPWLEESQQTPAPKPSVVSHSRPSSSKPSASSLSSSGAHPCDWKIASIVKNYRKQVINWLDRQRISYRILKEPDTVNRYHIVMTHALGSLAEAYTLVNQLQQRGYKAPHVFQSGPWKNAVSIGVYRRERAAKGVLATLQSTLGSIQKTGEGRVSAHIQAMKHPPVIPLIYSKLTKAQKDALQARFPPLRMAQACKS